MQRDEFLFEDVGPRELVDTHMENISLAVSRLVKTAGFVPNARDVYDALVAQGVKVRDMDEVRSAIYSATGEVI